MTKLMEGTAPRWITVDGLSNVRDIGGWSTMDGKRIRQGCIYRGCEMNAITPEGIHTLREELCIHTDLDLRGEVVGKVDTSPLGDDVQFLLIPASAYDRAMINEPERKETICRLFSVLADETNYPIYFHCQGGADRTGTLAFLLNAVLGVPYDMLAQDYELTSLSNWGIRSRHKDEFVAFMKALDSYSGRNVNEKAEDFLRTCGVGDDIFIRLRNNLIAC